MTKWENRIVGRGDESPDQLLANPRNWRIHPKHQQDAMAAILDRVGWVKDVIVNKQTGCVVDGHLRVGLALSQGADTIPVLYVDLTEDEERAVIATLDPIAGLAESDEDAYDELVNDLGEGSESTPGNGSAEDVVQALRKGMDEPPPAPSRPEREDGPIEAICPGCAHEWTLTEEEAALPDG